MTLENSARLQWWRHAGITWLVIAFGACGGSTEPKPLTVAGTWHGQSNTGSTPFTATLTLAQTGTVVTGNGNLSSAGFSAALTVSGTFVEPNLSVTIVAQGYQNMNFTAPLTGESMIGTLNGSGFNNVGLHLVRQR
jgi:hypothetical protein